MMKLIRIVLAIGLGWAALGVWAGFGGAFHPAGDSIALLRIILGVICFLGCLWQIKPLWRVILGGTGAVALLTTLPLFFGGQPGGELTLYTKNIWFGNTDTAALARDIRDSRAEVVMLQEVSNRNEAILASLAGDFPHQHLCRFSGWNGIAVLSRYPFSDDTICSDPFGLAAARISRDGQQIWIGSVHFYWPYPYGQQRSRDAARAILEQLEGPVVVAGDFNMFPWASSVQQVGRAANATLAGPIRPTFMIKGVPLLLDHVLAPGGGHLERRPLLGSDHNGVVARVHLVPS